MNLDIDIDSIYLKDTQHSQTLLYSFAHPDDESFGPAGTLIHYAQHNTNVHYICGTRGEAGTVDEVHLHNIESIAALRTQELLKAAEYLGLSSIHFLNYRDSGMENSADNDHPDSLFQAPMAEVVEKIVRVIRTIKPEVLVTFDPSGGYFHPDHIKMHQATTIAFNIAASAEYPEHADLGLKPFQPQKLYYVVFSRKMLKTAIKFWGVMGKDTRKFGKNQDIDLERIAAVEYPISTKIDVQAYYDVRQKAAQCHASQLHGMPIVPNWLRKYMDRNERYLRVWPTFKPYERMESDFFTNLG